MQDAVYKYIEYTDPFQVDKHTRLIHLFKESELSPMDRGALLSRYSRSSKSMIDLIETEFTDPNRGTEFYKKVLIDTGDDSIAELDSQQIGLEGLSLVAATKLTDRRIGISFIEKSSRYMQFTPDSFYTPAEVYEAGLVDEFRALCALSHKTFSFIHGELSQFIIPEQYPIASFTFPDSKTGRLQPFPSLTAEEDITTAERSYHRAVKDKAFDIAGYCWLGALKTSIGLNANCRALEHMLTHLRLSPVSELNDLGYHMLSLLSTSIEPLITRARTNKVITNPLGIYGPENSVVSLYKHNVTNLMKAYDSFDEGVSKNPKNKANVNLVKTILSDMGVNGDHVHINETNTPVIHINQESFRPTVKIVNFMNEKHCIDTLSSAILFESNENLLDYDDQNSNNIDQNLRIVDVDQNRLKQGILYDIVNGNKGIEDFNEMDTEVNRTTENTLDFNDMSAYFEENNTMSDQTVYQDFNSPKTTINKEQEYLIKKYIGDRKNRRQKLGRAFEFIEYSIEFSTSWKIMRDLKRHRIGSALYPAVVTARNSYDSYIFPDQIIKNEPLFKEYKALIAESFKLYSKVAKKTNNYHAAQYCNIMGTRANYIMRQNFRELDYWLSLRSGPQGHPEYRHVAQGVYNLLRVLHPNLCKLMTFVDMNEYPLGRLQYEYNKQKKLAN